MQVLLQCGIGVTLNPIPHSRLKGNDPRQRRVRSGVVTRCSKSSTQCRHGNGYVC
jgi:hypothetical protein